MIPQKPAEAVKRNDESTQDIDQISVPSELSEDMWGELPRYQYQKHLEQIAKEKEEQQRKRNLVR